MSQSTYSSMVYSGLIDDNAAHFKYYENDSHISNWFEWWYLNVKSNTGHNVLIEFFTFRDLNDPFTSWVGTVMIVMHPDGSVFKSIKTYPFISYNLDYERCNITIMGDRFEQVNKSTLSVTYTNSINEVNASFTVTPLTEPIGGVSARLSEWKWMEWRVPIPCGEVEGVVEYHDNSGIHRYALQGRAYHDHNWGINTLRSMDWHWGEFSNEYVPLGITYGLAETENGSFSGGIYATDAAGCVSASSSALLVDYIDWERVYGFMKPTKFTLFCVQNNLSINVTVSLILPYPIGIGDIGLPYLFGNMCGVITIHGKEYTLSNMTGFYEYHFFGL